MDLETKVETVTAAAPPPSILKEGARVYISGKISGLRIQEVLANFTKYENTLMRVGLTPVNPMKQDSENDPTKKWEDFMREDIKLLMDCDAIFLMPNWDSSRGARLERFIAQSLNIPCIEESQEFVLLRHTLAVIHPQENIVIG